MSAITTHVLDVALGRPAAGVVVRLERVTTSGIDVLAEGTTDAAGRAAELGPASVDPGTYRLVFDTAGYFGSTGQAGFFPHVAVDFEVADATQHYHVPLLLSPFSYSTYRGS